MAWIESHQDLANHPKTRRLMRTLQITRRDVVGMLHLLWWWAMEYAPEGSLAGYSPPDIADAVDWEGDPGILVAALLSSGFLDENENEGELRIHDWWDYAGKLLEKRRQDAERKRSSRTHPKPVQGMSDGRPEDGARNRNRTVTVTVPNQEPPTGGADDPASAADIFITIETKDGQTYELTTDQVDEWQVALPHVDVEAEIHKAVLWHKASPERQKTKRGMTRFLSGWLLRDRPAPSAKSAPQPAPPPNGLTITTNGGRSVFDLIGGAPLDITQERTG